MSRSAVRKGGASAVWQKFRMQEGEVGEAVGARGQAAGRVESSARAVVSKLSSNVHEEAVVRRNLLSLRVCWRWRCSTP